VFLSQAARGTGQVKLNDAHSQCISINHNYANSRIIRNIYDNLLASLRRVEDSIADILPLLKQRLGNEQAFTYTDGETQEDIFSWEVEWVDEVQKVLEMDAGWGLAVFWDMVLHNLEASPRSVLDRRLPLLTSRWRLFSYHRHLLICVHQMITLQLKFYPSSTTTRLAASGRFLARPELQY
jgi:hypothetical protein